MGEDGREGLFAQVVEGKVEIRDVGDELDYFAEAIVGEVIFNQFQTFYFLQRFYVLQNLHYFIIRKGVASQIKSIKILPDNKLLDHLLYGCGIGLKTLGGFTYFSSLDCFVQLLLL